MLAEILGPDLLVILVIVGLLFGSSRLPTLARSLGSAKREFEAGMQHQPEPDHAGDEGAHSTVTMTKAEIEALLAERERTGQEMDPPKSG